jgi:2,3-bisphosphoglycerate-dependent phosphoglycerate mutase
VAKYKIYLFRHGQTTYNRDKRFTGHRDPLLTTLGVSQAKKVAKKLKNKQFQIAFETRLRRSKETLNQVLKYHPECVKIIIDNRMIERNYGNLNGTTHESFIHRVGRKLEKLDVTGDAYENLSKADRSRIEHFLGEEEYKLIHRGYNVPPPKGESFAMVESRVSSFIKDLIKLIKKEKVNVAISAHGNSIRLFRKIMEKASKEKAIAWTIPYDNYYEYTINV